MQWITITEAIKLTGKADLTIRRLVKKHKSDSNFIRKENGRIWINTRKLNDIYAISDNISKSYREAEDSKTNQMHIVSSSETIKELSEHIKQRDKQIEFLLQKKNRTPLWISLSSICLIMLILSSLYFAFINYRDELISSFQRETDLLQSRNKKVVDEKEEQINHLKFSVTEKRQELAQKDRLISELYNDTKEQNKKLLELTESLKKEVIKNKQKENNLPEKQAQNQ